MEHTQIVTASELEDYAQRRDSEAVIPELVWWLVTTSVPDITACRIPYSDSINLPGLDGLVETESGFRQFVPTQRSFWETGRGDPQTKATEDYRKRTKEISAEERQTATFVFVTARSRTWSQSKQAKWVEDRGNDEWRAIKILDGVQLADWLREFPAIGKWLLNKIGLVKNANGFETVAEHWTLLSNLKANTANDPPLPPTVFLVGREKACEELNRLFRGETTQLLLATESEKDAEDFVAAFLESLDVKTRQAFSSCCLFISDADTWHSFANLRASHILVASPRLDLESNEQLLMAARKNGHRIIIPVSGTWSHGNESLIPIRSPSKSVLETAFRDGGFEPERARELAGAGAQSLAALKRYLLGLGDLPPYATWENARILAQTGLIGKWQGGNAADRSAVEMLLGKPYGEWIEVARSEALRSDSPLIQRNENWKMISRGEAWSALGARLTNADLDCFQKLAIMVLGEKDAKFDLPIDERFAAGKTLSHSDAIREGVAESLALLGSKPAALSSCTRGKAELTASIIVRKLLQNADWVKWASLNSSLPLLAEAAPDEFLDAVEAALLNPSTSPFLGVFAQESNGFGGWNYTSGLLWALETLAWNPDYLVRITTLLGELAAIDPGGNWSNRPKNSLVDIFLPWHPQTSATIPQRIAAVEALLRDQPDVGWTLLVRLLPSMHGTTSGTRKPTWRNFIPNGWQVNVTHNEYWEQVSGYAELTTKIAATDLLKLTALIDRLPDLPNPAYSRIIDHIGSDAVVLLPESVRLPLWETLVDVAAKHRKYADAQWAMPAEFIAKIEVVATKLAPTSTSLLQRRLFSEREIDLYEENGDFEEQRLRLDQKRQEAIKEILAAGNIEDVLAFARQVDSPRKVGFALGSLESPDIDTFLLPVYLGQADKTMGDLVGNFVWGRYWGQKWTWVDTQLDKGWNTKQILALLVLLPFDPEVWHRAEQHLGNDAVSYWKAVNANPWGLEQQYLFEAAEKLISNEQPRAAIDCLYTLSNKRVVFPAKLVLRALMGVLASEAQAAHLDQYQLLEVIKWLQENEPEDSEDLFQIEWRTLPLLNRLSGGEPKLLERRLATKPDFFCEVIAAIFRSDKDENTEREVTDTEKSIARNAYHLLHGWRTLPGTTANEDFDDIRFDGWLAEVKRLTTKSGHFKIAMDQLGQALAYAPADPDGLWIRKAIAAALDAKDAPEMRSAFTSGLFNKRGVHGFSAGKEEQMIAINYREKANALADNGFHRVADAVRKLAQNYENDAIRESERDVFTE
ncbi:MAG: hypothetical protein PHI11_09160 [Gallionella sp.]|nr:hypothetical protein [Gallionella sp.]